MAKQSTSNSKKKPTVKKAASKKAPAKARPLTWRFYAVTIGIFVVATATIFVIGLLASSTIMTRAANERYDRISDIYSSLELNDSYVPVNQDIFGDKRVYDWDKSRTYSSWVKYRHGDTVSNTVAELDAKIKAAGFSFVDEPYPGSVYTQYHYKSANNEYIRLTVVSKPYNDAIENAATLGQEPSEETYALDKNAAPALVTIKVNLDDNNE